MSRRCSSRQPALPFAAGVTGDCRASGFEILQVSFFLLVSVTAVCRIRGAACVSDFQVCIPVVVVVLGICIQIVHQMLMVL